MGTSMQQLQEWHQRGLDQKSNYMIIVCDTFSYEDYPVYVEGSADDAREKKEEYNKESMQRVMEVYDLSIPFEATEIREMAV